MRASNRVAVLIGLIACHGLCQTNGADPVVQQGQQEDLLRAIGVFVSYPIQDPVVANGPEKPPPQDTLGLTDQEAQVLKTVAKDYQTKKELFVAAVGPLRMESLFQTLDSGRVSVGVAQRIRDLQNEYAKVVSALIRRLEGALGTSRFDALDALVRSGNWPAPFGPTIKSSK